MYVVLALVMRAMGGVGLSLALGVIGIILVRVFFFYGGGYLPVTVFFLLLFSIGGIASGAGTFFGWMDTSNPLSIQILLVAAYIALGLVGAWGGYYYRISTIENAPGFTSTSLALFSLFWAAFLTNVLAISFGILRNIRSGWI